ncbi:hypothetical protein AVEN_143253-1 [Araneus ventricosus]|uniref:Uncharacterized protein n=1 Tax=Araneus ventricosus TaxID=182803 RepID=A0A4Y2AF23_ARAVE|nr:hypothetical protein AVEN_143253-1 [Araneus ventricosus]
MTRTTPELALLSPSSLTIPIGWRLAIGFDLARHGLHTVESGFEPGILQPRTLPPGYRPAPLPAVVRFMTSTDHCPRPLPSNFFLNMGGFFCEVKKYALFT